MCVFPVMLVITTILVQPAHNAVPLCPDHSTTPQPTLMSQINRFEEFSQHSVLHRNANYKDKDKDVRDTLPKNIVLYLY